MYVQSSVLYTVRIESGYIFIKNNQSWNHKTDNDSILHKYYNFWLTKAKGNAPFMQTTFWNAFPCTYGCILNANFTFFSDKSNRKYVK